MHPILKNYLESEVALLQIVEKNYDPNIFLECVFLEILKVVNSVIPRDKSLWERIDLSIIKGHYDTDLFLFFLLNTHAFFLNERESRKAATIASIADSMVNDNAHSILRALYAQMFCNASFFGKNAAEYLRMMKRTTTLAGYSHPRCMPIFSNYFIALAFFGRLNDTTEEEKQIEASILEGQAFGRMYHIQLRNCSFIGDYVQGFRLLKEFQAVFNKRKLTDVLMRFNKKYMNDCQGFEYSFRIFSGDLNPEHYEDAAIKHLLVIFNFLINGDIDAAIESYKDSLNSEYKNRIENSELARYLSVHFELFLGNTADARRILEDKWKFGEVIYLNDLFFVRILLLEGNYEEAHHMLKRLMKNVEKYGAINRVLFELQFAKEFKVGHLFSLLHKWKELPLKTVPRAMPIKEPPKELMGVDLLIGKSLVLSNVKSLIKRYAPLDETVLIVGETGTGKELVARALHHEGHFSKEPFLAINCGALTDTLLESELFGYEAGAFTGALRRKEGLFESAGKGTVFLDEFGDISPKLQVSLLRVLEYREFRMIGGAENRTIKCRIIVATNKDIKQAVDEKLFREDLYYRLLKLEIKLPSLRERLEDLPDLVNHFLKNSIFTFKKSVTEDFLNALAKYHWPGNIRELKNGIERLRILNPNKSIFGLEELSTMQFQGEFTIPKTDSLQQKNTLVKPTSHDDSTRQMIREGHLNSKQRLAYIKELFLEHKILTRSQIIQITRIHPTIATRELRLLCTEGFILKKQPSKSSRSIYFELKENTNSV